MIFRRRDDELLRKISTQREKIAQISNEELIKTASDMINAKRSAQRIRGAKLILKHALATLGEQLYAAFLRELKDARTWEVKSEMPKALGAINFTAATGEIIRLLKTGSYSVVIGAVTALTVDQMIPCEAEILEILKLTKDAHKHKDGQGSEFGLIDPRTYVAAACANWLGGSEAVRQWLHHCKLTAVYRNSFGEERVDLRLIQICDLALKRKFPKAYVGF